MKYEVVVSGGSVTMTDRVNSIVEADNKVDELISEIAHAFDLDLTPENLSRTKYSISIKSIGGESC